MYGLVSTCYVSKYFSRLEPDWDALLRRIDPKGCLYRLKVFLPLPLKAWEGKNLTLFLPITITDCKGSSSGLSFSLPLKTLKDCFCNL
ncbi:hypothetical protein CDAR_28671 [Caerostris darwini]|uniref:Uncharacterized protein n=1 Tax=Caerostris darwini TaxID=1538125 RepID=A0AAV4Q5R9_9ARAC|nr:hypothetical protein CDAR_28671 [Caerostris darwini]